MKTENKKVSIIIPVYNGSNYIKEAIKSALNQTYSNIEVIVINDGSCDNGKTRDVCSSFGTKIKYYEKENGGVSSALNYGIKKMTGEYFSWLSHDDRYYPKKIELEMKEIVKWPNNTIIYSNYDFMDSNSVVFSKNIVDHKELLEKPEYSLLLGNINGLSLLIPKSAFNNTSFNENLKCLQDYEMWLNLIKTYNFVHIDNVLVSTRLHDYQVTNTSPVMVSEGDSFWPKAIEYPTKKRKIELEGSEYNYYKRILGFLITTPYTESIKYVENKMFEFNKNAKTDIEEIENNSKKKCIEIKTNIFKKIIIIIKNKGIIYVIKRILNK